MNKHHTLIVALAVTVKDDMCTSLPAFEHAFDGIAERVSVVGVLDRNKPENNFEPQIFAAWPEEAAHVGSVWRCLKMEEDDGGVHRSIKYAKEPNDVLILRDQGYTCSRVTQELTPSSVEAQREAVARMVDSGGGPDAAKVEWLVAGKRPPIGTFLYAGEAPSAPPVWVEGIDAVVGEMRLDAGDDSMSPYVMVEARKVRDWASQLEAFAEAASALSAPVVASPPALEGMVLVPREPTAKMLDAAIASFIGFSGEGEVDEVWAAMLAASPAPAQQAVVPNCRCCANSGCTEICDRSTNRFFALIEAARRLPPSTRNGTLNWILDQAATSAISAGYAKDECPACLHGQAACGYHTRHPEGMEHAP